MWLAELRHNFADMKNLLLFFIIFLGSLSLAAQSGFEKGYIVTSENETIRGMLQAGTDAELATQIVFKTGPNGTAKAYSPEEVSSFGFDNGRRFERMPVIYLKETAAETSLDTSYIFAKNLVQGKIDMYVRRFPNRPKPHIFLTNRRTEDTVHLKRPGRNELLGMDGRALKDRNFLYMEKLEWIKDPSANFNNPERIKYSEKRIKKHILKYNQQFEEEFPVHKYSEEINNEFTLLAGIPFQYSGELHFRTGLYRNKINVERTSNFSFMQGIVYHHRDDDQREIPSSGAISYDYRWQHLNIIPVGVNFHGNSKRIRPYGYAGLGVAVSMIRHRSFENFTDMGSETRYEVMPTINVGMGVKFRVGSNYAVAELTPTFNGIFANLGFSL